MFSLKPSLMMGTVWAALLLLAPCPIQAELIDRQPSVTANVDSNLEADMPIRSVGKRELMASLTIFVLAVFVGFEIITKVPPTLHTPLMSGSNAISGITIVGALIVSGNQEVCITSWSLWLGLVAVVLAAINVVGGFLVTHRMLAMFKKRKANA